MTDEAWRPLGVDDVDEIAEYDALHDGVPPWMNAAYWAWVEAALTTSRRRSGGAFGNDSWVQVLDLQFAEQMCQRLQIPLPDLRIPFIDYDRGKWQIASAMSVLREHSKPLQIADYVAAYRENAKLLVLDEVLTRSKSAFTVGKRGGRPGLVRRVPVGVQEAADSVMSRAGRAGVRLAKAWEELYGLNPNASAAYRQAILAVEDAAIPVVSPTNKNATLGTVLKQMGDQKNWRLPMDREYSEAPTGDVLIGMMRTLWHGQHDRHGGQPSAPGNVSVQEATVAVSLAVAIVNVFDAGLVQRGSAPVTPPSA